MSIIDFHTHAFPDGLAARAISSLEAGAHCRSRTDGTVAGLLAEMDRGRVGRAVVLSIATKPTQLDPIIDWSVAIAGERVIPFASVHPETPDLAGACERIRSAEIKGVKLHPMYQNFVVDDPRVFPLYEALEQSGLVVLMHAGYDIAFGDNDCASPERFGRMLDRFPALRLVLAHLGGWRQTDSFLEVLAGRDVYIDTSFSIGYCSDEQLSQLLSRHPANRILFGSDAPWGGIAEHVEYVRSWPVDAETLDGILFRNAEALLG